MIAITGATGHLGKLVINDLLKQNTNPKTIVAVVRDKAKAQDIATKGVELRIADYKSPEALEKAFAGIEKLLLISGSEVGQRIAQHTNVVNAAKKAGVKEIIYTSVTKADTSKMQLAIEHLATEKMIQASGIPYVILRNSWYIENYTGQLANYIASGVVAGSAQNGRVSAATRADFAAAAASALLGRAKTNTIYELGGKGFTLTELAQTISHVSGKKVEYKDMPQAEFAKLLMSFGLPEGLAQMLADSDVGIQRGDLFTERRDFENLIGRAPTSLESAIKSALA